ncbi:MAG TPA: DinB family protein [Vicinamibacterales bacterium]|nr:DinB family protein [Vicinamibacterales bacterium]
MRTIRTRSMTCVVALAAVLSVAPLRAQATQTALSKEAGTLSDKFAGLARVLAGKYTWKPGEGVRSVGDVFNLIVTENGLLTTTLTGASGAQGGARPAPITDPEKMQDALKTSYANVQKAIEKLSDADLKAPVKLFGRDFTKEEAVRYLFADQHEHLGQSIAYARSNAVVPPWSK